MSLSQSDFERAEDYVAGRLSATDQTQFEHQLTSNPELASETARLQTMRNALRRLAYRDEMVARHAELVSQGAIQPPAQPAGRIVPFGQWQPLWRYMAVAASVFLLLGLGWFFLINRYTASSPADVANRFLENDLRLDSTTQNGEPLLTAPGPDQLEKQQAISRDTSAIRLGLRLLQSREPAKAITVLEPARNCPLPDWQANARYLLALGYLQTEQLDRAKAELTTLQTTPYFGKQASQLLAELAANEP